MASLITGYEYDIFVSYRQKDNKYDGWVTDFVNNLKRELEATFKEEISVYFDVNPHDGLLETYDVDASLKDKLKCLIFIPIISRTYCDPKSFAWEHEFKVFVEVASNDQFGLKVKLPNGNVATRVLPIRIHDLDDADIKICECALGGALRGVEFIYKEPGVNRSLTAIDDEKKNLNNTKYRNQINKVALATKEIIMGLQAGQGVRVKESVLQSELFGEVEKGKKTEAKRYSEIKKHKGKSRFAILAILIIAAVLVYTKIFKRDSLKELRSSGEKISIAVMPFQNLTNDTTWNIYQEGIQTNLITSLANTGELFVRKKDNISNLIKSKGLVENAALSPSVAGTISGTLEADIFIYGSIQHAGSALRLNAQLIDTKTNEVLKSFEINGSYLEPIIFDLADSLRKRVTDYLIISKLIKENPDMQHNFTLPKSADALKFFLNGGKAREKGDVEEAIKWYKKSLEVDSNFFIASFALENSYGVYGGTEESYKLLIRNYQRRDRMSLADRYYACWAYEYSFGPPESQIRYLRQLQELDDQDPANPYLLGWTYSALNQYDKACIEYEKYFEIVRKWGKDYLKENYVYGQLGRAYHNTGQTKQEKKLYDESDKYSPDYDYILFRRAILADSENDSVLARKYINRFIEKKRANSATEAEISHGLGECYEAFGKLDQADAYYNNAFSLEPEKTGRLVLIADFYIKNNMKLDEVPKLMDKMMKLAKTKVDYYNYMNTKGWALYKQGKQQEALEILQKCWDEAPFKLYSIKSHLEEVKKAVAGHT